LEPTLEARCRAQEPVKSLFLPLPEPRFGAKRRRALHPVADLSRAAPAESKLAGKPT
jgi:hypothetical protein